MKFKFLDKVRVVKPGFYCDAVGVIIEQETLASNGLLYSDYYWVLFHTTGADAIKKYFKSTSLELVNADSL